MPELNFTPEQRAAIDTRGSTVLVSAAAGSGKTRVLTERLMAYLTDAEHPVDIDHFLVITYTRAAAAELRSRGFDVNLLLLTTPCTVTTDVQMLKRVTDNLLSNIEKYADPAARLTILAECEGERLHVCFANRARRELARVESNHIGLRTCEAILQLLGGQFFTHRTGDDFSAEFVLPRTPPDAAQG